jgi:hypothetical protein
MQRQRVTIGRESAATKPVIEATVRNAASEAAGVPGAAVGADVASPAARRQPVKS